MSYVDGFVIPLPKKNVAAYRRLSRRAGRIWMEHGALDYKECVGDELGKKRNLGFLGAMKAKPSETVVFAWIAYRSKRHRDRVNAKIMADPRILRMNKPGAMPFDVSRMLYGGFAGLVEF